MGRIRRPRFSKTSWVEANRPSVWAASAVLGVLVVGRIVPFGGNLVYLVCAGYALAGCRQAIQALTIMLVVLMASAAWVPDQVKDLRWLVLGCSLLSVGIRTSGTAHRLAPGTLNIVRAVLAFVVIEILVTVGLGVSRAPTVSLFKLLSFGAGAVTLVLGFAGSMTTRRYWDTWFTGWFAGVFAASLLVLPLGGGFLRNGVGFEGALVHPQTMGIVSGVAASYFFSRFLFYRDGHLVYLMASVISVGCVAASQARTGGLAFLLGGVVAVGLLLMRGRRDLTGSRIARWWPTMAVGCILTLPLVPGQVSEMMNEYVVKGDDETGGIFESLIQPREEAMNLSLENHARHPILGIGFGMPSTGATRFTEVMGIPVSASVEKGFLPTADSRGDGMARCSAYQRASAHPVWRPDRDGRPCPPLGDEHRCPHEYRRSHVLLHGRDGAVRLDDDRLGQHAEGPGHSGPPSRASRAAPSACGCYPVLTRPCIFP